MSKTENSPHLLIHSKFRKIKLSFQKIYSFYNQLLADIMRRTGKIALGL